MNILPAYPVIVLVTVNDNETHALLDAFVGEGTSLVQVSKGGLTYNDLGMHGGCQIVHTVCEMGAGGIGASQQRTSDAIDHWHPKAIIAVGIAFGLDEIKQDIGDVLVSTQIQDYELGRLSEDGILTPRGDKPSSADILRNRFRQTDTNESRCGTDWPKVRFGLILSGQKLIDNLNYRESLKALFAEAIGGEMEGVGLYVSATAAKVDWIVVKAICDWGHSKNQADKDAWQKLAARNAAKVLKAALDVGGLYCDVPLPEKAKMTDSEATPSAPSIPTDISHIIKYAPAELIGRGAETKLLNDAWDQAVRGEAKRPHVLTIVALGGEGKTSLVAKWAADLAHQNWPGCDAVFAWSFYSQGTHDAASSDLFLKEALTFFGDAEMAESSRGAYDKGRRLAQLVGERRALLVLDGVEPLQYAPTSPMPGELKDAGIAVLLKGLAASNKGLCVVTTRHSIPDLKAYWQTTAPEEKLTRLSNEAGVALLKSLGVNGTQKEFETLVEDVKGHALTLNLLGSYLRDAYAGDIRKRDLVKLAEASDEQGGHAFRVMDAYVQWFETGGKDQAEIKNGLRALSLLRLLGLFDRPAPADCIAELLKAPVIPDLTELLVEKNEAKRNIALARLENAKLLTVNRDAAGKLISLDAHPLLREYFAKQIREQHPGAWRNAHRRIYKHLVAITKEGDQPTLEELQPLYQAVAHGCQAGMQLEACEKVYHARITRGTENYSSNKLGAFGSDLGAVAFFFEQPWSRLSPALSEPAQAWLLNEAAYSLRALGRLTEAVGSFRTGLEMSNKQKDWVNAAAAASNLSELELTLGDVAGAVRDAEQSVTYADLSGDSMKRMIFRTTHADALHQEGRLDDAEVRFCEAEVLQSELQPDYPLLYSLRGFQYCDLLLAAPETAAWQLMMNADCEMQIAELEKSCLAITERASQTLEWSEIAELSLLEIPLDYLTMGRNALYEAILENSAPSIPRAELDQAVGGLRNAGQQQYLPLGLLTRAWLRSFEGKHTGSESAQADLDEAWEIAERGPMPLFMADIHMYRARLFFREESYPWESPQADLAEARRLIEKHGYLRRLEELEDAESVILGAHGPS